LPSGSATSGNVPRPHTRRAHAFTTRSRARSDRITPSLGAQGQNERQRQLDDESIDVYAFRPPCLPAPRNASRSLGLSCARQHSRAAIGQQTPGNCLAQPCGAARRRRHETACIRRSVAHRRTCREPGSGLSRRRSRVRAPSLPSLEVPANRHVLLPARDVLVFHPAHIPHGNRRRKTTIAADSRNPDADPFSGNWIERCCFAGVFGALGARSALIPRRLRLDKAPSTREARSHFVPMPMFTAFERTARPSAPARSRTIPSRTWRSLVR
jgi:hypothetical protein